MITEQSVLDDLITEAMQPGNDPAVTALLNGIKDCGLEVLKGAAENFNVLFEAWEDAVGTSDEKAKVCLVLADQSILDTPFFRIALHDAARRLLPPYISSQAVAKSIGARDTGIAVNSVAARIRKIQKLRTNAYVFLTESQCWGKLVTIDKVLATIGINTFETNSMISLPVASALSGCLFFEQHIDMTNVIATTKGTLRPSAYYREIFARHSIGGISEEKIRSLLEKMFVPQILSGADFEKWWTDQTPAHATLKHRALADSRSILELHSFLQPAEGEPAAVSVDSAAAVKLAALFGRIRSGMAPKDLSMLAETIALLASSGDDETLKTMYAPLRGKVVFFPAEITPATPLQNLETWGRLAVKYLAGFIKAASILYTRFELAKLFVKLPQRCLAPMLDVLSIDDIQDAIFTAEKPTCDVLLCIWKNRAKFPAELREYLNMQNVSKVLSEENLPKEWAAAQRELKKLLNDKVDFQKYLLSVAGENISSFIYAIKKMRNMEAGECQSLLVKLSRISPAMKSALESGEGRKMMGGNKEEKVEDNTLMTSMTSFRRLVDELDNIVRVQIPENNKAIEHARSFGDFSENAEYDAAKERRSFLRRRRGELENLISTVQAIDFTQFNPDTARAAMGTEVVLEDASGKKSTCYLLGAFDGDPDRNYISYKTKFAKALLGRKAGETITLPEGGTAKIAAINPLSDAMKKELSSEE